MTATIPSPGALVSPRATNRVRTDVVRETAFSFSALALLIALASAVTNILPEAPIVGFITPLRLVLLLGLALLFVYGAPRRTFTTLLDVPLAILAVVSAWSTYESGSGLAPWRWFLTLLGAYYLTVGLARRWAHARATIAVGMLVAVACASLSALNQAASGASTGFCRRGFSDVACGSHGAMSRVEGTFVNPNLLAAFLVLVLPVAALAAWQLGTHAARFVGLAVASAGVLALLLTLSRAGIIAGLVASLVVASALTSRQRTSTAVRAGIAGALVLVTVAALAVGIGVRSQVWWAALATAAHHPAGVGLGKAGVYITARVPGNVQFAHAHNLWLTWLVEAGVLGFAALCALTILVARRLRLALRDADPMTVAIAAGLAGFAVACLADDPANITSVALPMMVMLALAITTPVPLRGKRALRSQ